MAQSAGRLTCPRCGANNFNTVTACWKCGTALGPGTTPATAALPYTSPSPTFSSQTPERAMMPPPASFSAVIPGDPGAAKRAAAALGLTFPWIGLPVGWVFMMLEDERKQAIGRFCAIWSTLGLVLHLFFMFALTQSLVHSLLPFVTRAMVNSMPGASRGGTDTHGLEGGGAENGLP